MNNLKEAAKILGAVCRFIGKLTAKVGALIRLSQRVSRKIPEKNRKEKHNMPVAITSIIPIGIAVFAVFAALGAFCKFVLFRKKPSGEDGTEESPVSLLPPQAPKPVVPVSFAKKNELEQKMVGITGGDMGMISLLEMIEIAAKEGRRDDQYRESYREKQKKLRMYMDEYQALMKQAESLPEDERRRFMIPESRLKRYRELLEEKV